MSPDHIQFERRAGQRFEFHRPITVRVPGKDGEGLGFTQNLCSKGALLQTDFALHEGENVELTVVMPSEITLGEDMRVRCRGRVLRVTSSGSGSIVAVHFADYKLRPRSNIPAHRISISDNEPFEQQAGPSAHTFSMRGLA
jgi:PilZ domain